MTRRTLSLFLLSLPFAISSWAEEEEAVRYVPPAMSAVSAQPAPTPPRTTKAPLNLDTGLAFNPVTSLLSDDKDNGSRVSFTPSVFVSALMIPGLEFFVGGQYATYGVPVDVAGKTVLGSSSAFEIPFGLGFPLRWALLGEETIAIFRTGLLVSLPMSSLFAQNQMFAESKVSYATYLEAGALFPVNEDLSLGASMRMSIGLSNAYEKNALTVERTFVYGFAFTSRIAL